LIENFNEFFFSAKISNIYSHFKFKTARTPFKFKMGEYATDFCDKNDLSKISVKQCEFQ
jgi:hypothetical protein